MTNRWKILASSAAMVATTAAYAAYNFSAINNSLQKAADQITKEFDTLEEFSLIIDEEATNVDEGKFLIRDTFTLVNLPWGEGETATMSGSEAANITVKQGENDQETYVIDQQFDANVDVLAMLSYYGERTAQKCEAMDPQGLKGAFLTEGCEMAKALVEAENLQDVAVAMKSYKDGTMNRLNAFNASVQKQIGTEAESLLQSVLLEQQAEAQDALKQLEAFSVDYQAGKTNRLVLKGAEMEIFEIFQLSEFELIFTEQTMSGNAMVRIESPFPIYKLSEPEIKAFLKDLENDEEIAVRHVSAALKLMWGIGEKIMMLN